MGTNCFLEIIFNTVVGKNAEWFLMISFLTTISKMNYIYFGTKGTISHAPPNPNLPSRILSRNKVRICKKWFAKNVMPSIFQ